MSVTRSIGSLTRITSRTGMGEILEVMEGTKRVTKEATTTIMAIAIGMTMESQKGTNNKVLTGMEMHVNNNGGGYN